MFETLLLQAQGGGQFMSTLIMMGLMFMVFWLLVWRPQSQEQQRHEAFIKGLKAGDEVVTASGILGKVKAVEDEVVTLEIGKKVQIRVLRKQIQLSQAEALGGGEGGDKEDEKDEKSGAW